jgi:hypothetical protein
MLAPLARPLKFQRLSDRFAQPKTRLDSVAKIRGHILDRVFFRGGLRASLQPGQKIFSS